MLFKVYIHYVPSLSAGQLLCLFPGLSSLKIGNYLLGKLSALCLCMTPVVYDGIACVYSISNPS
jgi:hypothetical protein